jgi:hypothetical protein
LREEREGDERGLKSGMGGVEPSRLRQRVPYPFRALVDKLKCVYFLPLRSTPFHFLGLLICSLHFAL